VRVRSYVLVLIDVHDFRNPKLLLYPGVGQTRNACMLQSVGQEEFRSEAIAPSVVARLITESLLKLVRHWEVTG
jgi:hypothetical protein